MPHAPALRILDANANRAREGLRVLEDYARFALNHDALCHDLKHLRHDLAECLDPWLRSALLERDTPGDVGTDNKTARETLRNTLDEVVIAAGKRLSEALRVIEEVLKLDSPPAAARVESMRYRVYALEQTLGRTLGRRGRFANVRLYVLITESACRGRWLATAESAIAGGADCLQLREKTIEAGELFCRAKKLVELCRAHSVLCIINDRADVAAAAGADGVHVGQEDMPAIQARKIVGAAGIVGLSTHAIEQARQAQLDGADYIGVGPIFPSATKPRDILPGPAYAARVAIEIPLPAVGIAGIDETNIDMVLATGLRAIAVTACVAGAADPQAAAARLKARLLAIDSPAISAKHLNAPAGSGR